MPNVLEPAYKALPPPSRLAADKSVAADKSDEDLLRLAAAIHDLRQRLTAIHGAAPAIGCFDRDQQVIPAIMSDDALANEIDVLRGELYELAWRICDVRARTLGALKLKARILQERCDEDHCDVIAALARSISRDIMMLPKWSF